MDISWLSKKVNSPNEEINVKLQEALALIDETVKTVRRIATQLPKHPRRSWPGFCYGVAER